MPDIDLYDRHPINAPQILEAARAAGHDLERLNPADLRPHDLDHYGGEAATLALAEAAGIRPGDLVADICAGMSGPARLIAERHPGARVVALDYNASRCLGAAELNGLTGMGAAVQVVRCDAQKLPLMADRFDAAISQEAFLHIPDKAAVLTGTYRALKQGGRLAFTDLTASATLTDEDRVRLATEGMQMVTLQSREQYETLAEAAGYKIVRADDLSRDWITILTERLAMYDAMADATAKVHGDKAHGQYMGPYHHFVGLVQQGHLGGLRLVLEKSGK